MSKKSFLRDRILLFLGVIAVVALYFLYAPFRAFLKEVSRGKNTEDFLHKASKRAIEKISPYKNNSKRYD